MTGISNNYPVNFYDSVDFLLERERERKREREREGSTLMENTWPE